MKKTGLLFLLLATCAGAQVTTAPSTPNANGVVETNRNVPFVRYQTPTNADINCAGFIRRDRIADANYVNGGLETPTSTKFETGELIYLTGSGYQSGQLYSIVREMRDINQFEIYPGERKLLNSVGHLYGEIGRVRIVDTRSHSAIAQVEFSCDPINPGDVATPYVEKPAVAFHVPGHFDRYAPPDRNKLSGRIILSRDFDLVLGTGNKVYLNVGANQGVKPGDFFRIIRSYSSTLNDPVDSLSFMTWTSEDTQVYPPTYEASRFERTKGPDIHVSDLPKRGVGEVVVLSVTPTSSSAMIVFSLEDVYAGDTIELDPQE